MAASSTLATDIINHFFRNAAVTAPTGLFLALFTVTPDVDGAGGTEVAGGSYARQAVTLGAPDANGFASNTNVLTFPTMPAAIIVAGALYSAVTGGKFWSRQPFSSAQSISAGANFTVKAGLITVQVR